MKLLNKLFLIAALFIFAACAGVGVPPAEAEVTVFEHGATTAHMDGTGLTDAEKAALLYRVYCGQTSGTYEVPVEGGSLLEHPIDGVLSGKADGKYYCAFTAYFPYHCDGSPSPGICESAKSNEVTVFKAGGLYYDGREPGKGIFGVR